MKRCPKCGQTKPLDAFYNDSRRANGKRIYCRECELAQNREHASRNRDKERERTRRWAKANPEKAVQYSLNWQKRNPDKCRMASASRRAKKRENGVFLITEHERKRLLSSPCAECGSTDKIQIDHIIPISRGGRHSIGNLQSLCASCNMAKSDMLLVEWRTKTTQAA